MTLQKLKKNRHSSTVMLYHQEVKALDVFCQGTLIDSLCTHPQTITLQLLQQLFDHQHQN